MGTAPDIRTDHLAVYLDDHVAGAVLGLELIEECLKHNPKGSLGDFLRELRPEVEADKQVLESLRARLGGPPSPAKKAAALVAEKASRLKLSRALAAYSDLNRFEELEGIALGIRGKMALWATLKVVQPFEAVDFDALEHRAAEG